MSLRYVTCICCALVLSALTVAAQSTDWSVVRSLAPDTEIRVAAAGKTITGAVQSVTDDALILDSGSGQQTLARPQITRISVKKKGHRLRNTLIGLGVGAGAALGIGAAASRCTNFCIVSNGLVRGAITAAGAIVGTIIGAVIPSGGWREVYSGVAK